MKTKQEQIDEMVKVIKGFDICGLFGSCFSTGVDGENTRRITCPECFAEALYNAGYGDVSEYKAEIERLKAEFKELETNAEILARGVRDLNHENYELTEKIKQAQIDVLNRVMTYINNKIENDYGDMSDSVNYLTIDIDDFDDFIDELIKEVQNGEDKG